MKKFFAVLGLIFLLSISCFATDFDGYIVKIKENPLQSMSDMSLFSDAFLLDEMDDSEAVRLFAEELPEVKELVADHRLLKVESEEALQEMIELGIVERYEEDSYLELFGYDVNENPSYADQKWFYDFINADFAWNAGIFGGDVKIALIDSGVYPHDDIVDNLLEGYNYVAGSDDVNDTTDNTPHGTYVAGLLAAQCNNLATVGLAFDAKIVPLKITNTTKFNMSNAILAIYDAVDKYDCSVINLSFGSSTENVGLYESIKYAIYEKNAIVVAAAGNDGSGYKYPASHDEVISVANAERSGDTLKIRYTSQVNDMIDVAAPGTYVLSLSATGGVASVQGTSFSCPLVAAVAALAKSVNPDITADEFQRLIKETADSSYLTSTQGKNYWGSGLLDVEAFFKKMLLRSKCFVSDSFKDKGVDYVRVTNLENSDIGDCSLIIKDYADGALSKFEVLTFPLGSFATETISLTEHGFSKDASVKAVYDHIPGDVDGNGKVNLRDASEILKYCADYPVSVVEGALDVNGDGKINLRDASQILRYTAGYLVEIN